MQRRTFSNWHPTDLLLSLFVLALLLWFTYGILFKAPYSGIYINPTAGDVSEIFVDTVPADLIQKGDVIQQIGEVSWESYSSDATQIFFADAKRGDTVPITIRRGDEIVTIPWVFPGFNRTQFLGRFFNIWWLAYFFWVFGLLTQFLIRPRDARRRLLIGVNYLTAVWLITGSLSAWHVGGGSLFLHAVTWLILPVYLNLHWDFPRPIAQMPKPVWIAIYSVGLILALFEFLQLLPRSIYALGFLLALLGSIILLIAHYISQPSQRRDVGLLVIVILVALVPSIGLGIVGTLGQVPQIAPLALLALPIMPGAYFFVIYRRQLGGLELRANRIMLGYSYLILLGTVLLFIMVPTILTPIPSETMFLITILVSLITAFTSIFLFPAFQSFAEQRLLGIKLPYQNLQETYSDRITTSTSLSSLVHILDNEVFPSLLVKQFVFFQVSNGHLKNLLARDVDEERLPKDEDIVSLISQTGKYLSDSSDDRLAHRWIRLILPLKIGEDLIGLWLLGRRDPDDIYSQAEIPILQSLANQTAIALSNVIQTERLKAMYEANIDRYEEEKKRLSLDLHDEVLNEMASLLINFDLSGLSPKFSQAYQELIDRLRGIIGAFRPPMLNFGFRFALEDIADKLSERDQNTTKIVLDIQADGQWRYPEAVENHLYRIVQEASENALKYAYAKNIQMTGRLYSDCIEIIVDDDGIGFDAESSLRVDDMVANKHFGLAGMLERASLIGAGININSKPNQGTRVQVIWKARESI